MSKEHRLQKFASLATHGWYGKLYKKLKPIDVEYCQQWLKEHGELEHWPFEMAVNRLFLDQAEKPKRLGLIADLLLACKN